MDANWITAMQSWGLLEMAQVLLATILAGIIGMEREAHGHAAGFRTTMLIGIGSCLFTTLSINGFPQHGAAQDTARVAAQIVTGVGFLGTGALFRDQHRTKGLTTAATIWVVAAISMAVGVGAYLLAVFTTVLVFITLRTLQPVSERLSHLSGQQLANGDGDEGEAEASDSEE